MNKLRTLSLTMFFGGLALFIAGVMTGETKIYIAVIFPIIQTSSILSIVGLLLMFGALFLWMFGAFTGPVRRGARPVKSKTKAGGVIMIGPIPIVLSNDKNLAIILMILALAIIIAMSLFMLFVM